MSQKYNVSPVTRIIEHRNPISGYQWVTHEIIPNCFEVAGPFVAQPRPRFRSEKAAQNHADLSEGMYEKFPFICPRSEKEVARALKYT